MSGCPPRLEPVLRVEGLSTEFATPSGNVRAVDGVSFDIPPGAAVGLVGESGSGKSTVALSILRLLGPGGRITGGRILFRGQDLLAKSPDELRKLRGNRLATVFQDPLTTLTPSLTIGEQIAETVLAHRGGSRRAAWDRAVELLGLMGVPDAASRARQYPHHLSGGMRQRVSIAIALSCEPDLVILDEPTTALDVTVQAQILDLLDRLRGERRLSMLFISHDLGVIARVCDAVCVLYGGRVVEQSPVEALFRGPSIPTRRASSPAFRGSGRNEAASASHHWPGAGSRRSPGGLHLRAALPLPRLDAASPSRCGQRLTVGASPAGGSRNWRGSRGPPRRPNLGRNAGRRSRALPSARSGCPRTIP
jgi:ABC-type dipeptide/oligopeptide/nickel transport system ATPase component